MKFVCLVYIDPAKMDAMTPEAGQQLIDATIEEDWALRRSGQLVLGQPLLEPQHARTLRADGTITDGPFAETREHLGGFTIIEAESMEAALALNATSPSSDMAASKSDRCWTRPTARPARRAPRSIPTRPGADRPHKTNPPGHGGRGAEIEKLLQDGCARPQNSDQSSLTAVLPLLR